MRKAIVIASTVVVVIGCTVGTIFAVKQWRK